MREIAKPVYIKCDKEVECDYQYFGDACLHPKGEVGKCPLNRKISELKSLIVESVCTNS